MALAIGAAAALGGGAWLLTRSEPAPQPPVLEAESVSGETTLPAAETEIVRPRFDVVRVAPDGTGIVAGRAAPGDHVTLHAGGEILAEAEAGPGGDFVASFRAGISAEPRQLTLRSEGEDGVAESEEHVFLLPPASPAEAAPGQAAAPDVPEAGPATAPTEVAATAILRPEGPEVLPGPAAADTLSLASIDYTEAGEVTLSGFAPAGTPVRIYVDGAHALDTLTDQQGRWQAGLESVSQGDHRLRVDALDADGTVSERVETPFRREFPDPAAPPGSITVQPGANLWTIARNRYGSGIHYTRIFTANANLIRDPDLIYPGQIFVLPEAAAANAEEASSRP